MVQQIEQPKRQTRRFEHKRQRRTREHPVRSAQEPAVAGQRRTGLRVQRPAKQRGSGHKEGQIKRGG